MVASTAGGVDAVLSVRRSVALTHVVRPTRGLYDARRVRMTTESSQNDWREEYGIE